MFMTYCDVSLPVPLDQAFTYRLPETMQHRVRPGCRVLVPFGSRKLTGMVLALRAVAPEGPGSVGIREALRLVDEEPVLDAELLSLGRWIAHYYCAPLGEVLRSMTPLSGEVHKTKLYSLTDAGRDAARQLLLGSDEEDATLQILRLLEARPLSSSYLQKKLPNAVNVIRSLEKKGFVAMEDLEAQRDPLRASAGRLRASWLARAPDALKLTKRERELHAFLELHPGTHNLEQLEASVKGASQAARSLARRNLITLAPEAPTGVFTSDVAPRTLNPHQLEAYQRIEAALNGGKFQSFLLEGVTGSGKTEVYLKSIDATIALGRSALLLVPEIALTPAVAGQFFHRFGDRVAILHSAFHDAERAEQWRRIRSGLATVVVGTRSGVFAPVQNLGLVVIDEEHDASYKQQETPRYNGRDVAIVRAREAGAVVVLGSATPSLESRYNAERGKYTLIQLPERIEQRPMPDVEVIDMRQEFLETRKQATFSRRLLETIDEPFGNPKVASS